MYSESQFLKPNATFDILNSWFFEPISVSQGGLKNWDSTIET